MSEPNPLHVTFVCTGNICRSPMAEKMFAHQLAQRGLGDAVRVTSAGTGNWHVGNGADERAARVLRAHGYSTDHRAAQVDDDHLARRPGGRLGPQPSSNVAAAGCRRRSNDGCCVRSTRARPPTPSTSRIPTTATMPTSKRCWPSSRPRCPACTTGSTSNSRKTDTVDASFPGKAGVPAATRLDSADPGGHRLHVPVLHGARAVAAGKEHPHVAGEPADRELPQHRTGSVENLAAAAGFVGIERAVAQGDRDRTLPARRRGAGPLASRRGKSGLRGAGPIRRRRRADGSRRSWLRTPGARLARPADSPPAARNGNPHGAAARLRAGHSRTRNHSPEMVSSKCIRSTPNRYRC